MAKQVAQSGILAKLGTARFVESYNKHKNDETTYSGFGELPGGVSGVAKLVDCRFGVVQNDEKSGKQKKNVGESFFFARAVVVEPTWFTDDRDNRHRIAGKGTSIFEMICDTPDDKNRKTVDDHLAQVFLYLRRLGLNTKAIPPEHLEAAMNSLINPEIKGFKPTYIYFSTSQSEPTEQYPNPRVFHNWDGVAEGYTPPSKTEAAMAGTTQGNIQAYNPNANGKGSGAAGSSTTSGKTGVKADDDYVLNDLAERADGGDAKAVKELTAMAKKAGLKDSVLSDPDTSWTEIAELIRTGSDSHDPEDPEDDDEGDEEEQVKAPPAKAKKGKKKEPDPVEDEEEDEEEEEPAVVDQGDDEEEEEEEPDTKTPEEGDLYQYKPVDKDGKEFKKAVDVEIVAVSTKNKTADVKNLTNQRVYKGVSWDKLIEKE